MTLGYIGSGTDTLPITRYNNKEYSIWIQDISPVKRIRPGKAYSWSSGGGAATSDTARYDIMAGIVKQIVKDQDSLVVPKLTSDITITAGVGAATTVVNGYDVILAGTTTPAVGDYVTLAGDWYKVIAKNNGVSLTLDRPYAGASATLTSGTNGTTHAGYGAAAGLTSANLFGLVLTAKNFNVTFNAEYNRNTGFDSGELVTRTTEMIKSEGLYADVLALEKSVEGWEGATNKVNIPDNIVRYANPSYTYNMWNIKLVKESEGHDGIHAEHGDPVEVIICLQYEAKGGGTAVNDLALLWIGDGSGAVSNNMYLRQWLELTPKGAGKFAETLI
jgi:hypothetical protein